jgi:hypothetical protein
VSAQRKKAVVSRKTGPSNASASASATARRLLARHRVPLLLAGAVVALAFYLTSAPNNPPGFFTDESSIVYNAYTISQTGSDEYGVRWPLYFRAFNLGASQEYKNPTYIYLLAGLFKIFGPSIWLARILSGVSGFGAALLPLPVGIGPLLARTVPSAESPGFVVGRRRQRPPPCSRDRQHVGRGGVPERGATLLIAAFQRCSPPPRRSRAGPSISLPDRTNLRTSMPTGTEHWKGWMPRTLSACPPANAHQRNHW